MRSYKIEEEHEHGNQIVGGPEGSKALFGLVPRLELLVEALYEIVGDIILKALNPDMLRFAEERLHRNLVGAVPVRDDGGGCAVFLCLMEHRNRLWRVAMRGQVIADDKARLAVDDKPQIVLHPGDFYHSFIRVPLVGAQIKHRDQPDPQVVKERRKFGAPVADGGMRNRDIESYTQNEADIAV